jgi:diamine N-acetyltransferase
MVGFLMYGRDEDGDQDYWLIRLMVDKQYPRRGYGRLAMLEAPGRDIRGSRAGGLLKV